MGRDSVQRGASVEHEYYESFYRNMTDNINLSNFKDRSSHFCIDFGIKTSVKLTESA